MSGSGGPNLAVVPEDVAAIGRYIYSAAENLRSALAATGREVEALTSGSWTGSAATTFGQGWHECADGGNQIIDALTDMAQKLGITATNYRDRDNRTATHISSLNL
ncbi:WXG100 family type VII secretion target [Nocardia alni]|uniref:WXG100 family type VII secretion target n=1 Tax=Nocardia alni TaxID=2815723 RepID=UPI0020B3F4CE|nr:WXG100 family type VII secretion target [Nocardia alni]